MSDRLLDVAEVRRFTSANGSVALGGMSGCETVVRLARTALAWLADRDAVTVERDEAYKQRDNCERKIADARAILGAAAGDLLSDAAERAACAVQHEANAMDIIGRALGRKVVGGADVAAIHASEEIERLRERVKALVGAERERDRILRAEADICKILGAAPDELLSDAARRHARTEELVTEARKYLGPLVCDPDGCDIEDLAVAVSKRVARMVEGRNERADEIAALRVRLDAAEAEPPQVFRPSIVVTVNHTPKRSYAEVVVGDVTDPRFLALPYGTRLGLVVCDG